MVVGRDGIVIIDTTDSLDEARKVWAEFEPHTGGKPVVAIIYTHNHNDHINGARAFPLVEGGQVIAQASLMAEAAKWNGVAAPAIAARAARMYGAFLPEGPEGRVNVGLGPYLGAFRGGGSGGFIAPTVTFGERLETTLGGERFVLEHAPGETDDQILIWMPERRVLFPGDNIYRTFPNLYTIRGTSFRDPLKWVASLDRMRALKPAVLVPSHTRPVVGETEIAQTLTAYRDAIQFVHDQTVRWMNLGLTPDEIAPKVKLPPHLKTHPFLLEHYGTVEWSVRGVFDGYMGWFGGDAAFLSFDPPAERAAEIVALAGGARPALASAEQAFTQGRWKWAAELATYVGRADPALKGKADAVKARALTELGYDQTSPNGRNYYLEQAAELNGKAPGWAKVVEGMGTGQAASFPAARIMAFFPVRLNADKAADVTSAVAVKFEGEGDFTIRVRRGISEVEPGVAPDAAVVVATSKADWLKALTGGAPAMAGALLTRKVRLEKGGVGDLRAFLELFQD
jgi:alkyl sulfatase BDS1-like metallo-beta-lactamase superfamily hydrolase